MRTPSGAVLESKPIKKAFEGRRAVPMKFTTYYRAFLKILLGVTVLWLAALTIGPPLLDVARRNPLNSLLVVAILVGSGVLVFLYIGELVVLGWIVDFLSQIGVPKRAWTIPLDYEQVGEIIVVTLPDNVASMRQCEAMQKQLRSLIDEHHCDFVFDFSRAEKLSRSFRKVLLYVMKAARKEAWNLGRPNRPLALPTGATFRVFADRQRAVEAMSKHDGHGWVVLCAVPVGIRAVSGLT